MLAFALPAYSQEKPQEPTTASPSLSAAGEKRLSDAWSKLLDVSASMQKAVADYNAVAAQEVEKGKFPKGTTFDVTIGDCKPDPTGGYRCRGKATPKLPQAAAPVPPPVTPPAVAPDKK